MDLRSPNEPIIVAPAAVTVRRLTAAFRICGISVLVICVIAIFTLTLTTNTKISISDGTLLRLEGTTFGSAPLEIASLFERFTSEAVFPVMGIPARCLSPAKQLLLTGSSNCVNIHFSLELPECTPCRVQEGPDGALVTVYSANSNPEMIQIALCDRTGETLRLLNCRIITSSPEKRYLSLAFSAPQQEAKSLKIVIHRNNELENRELLGSMNVAVDVETKNQQPNHRSIAVHRATEPLF